MNEGTPAHVFSVGELTLAADGLSLKDGFIQETKDLNSSSEPISGIIKENDRAKPIAPTAPDAPKLKETEESKKKETKPKLLETITYKLGQFTLSKVSFIPTRNILERISKMSNSDLEAFLDDTIEELQKAIPKLGTWEANGFSFERAVDGELKEKITAVSIQLDVLGQTNGFLSNIKFVLDKAIVNKEALASSSVIPAFIQNLNLAELDLKGQAHLFWDKATQEIRLADTTFTSSQLGALSLNIVLGHIPENFFSLNNSFQNPMLYAVSLKNVVLSAQDSGFLDFYLKAEAERTKNPMPTLREDLVKQVTRITSGMPETLTTPLLNLIKSSKKLDITMSSKKPDGVSFMEAAPLIFDYESKSTQFWNLWTIKIK